MGSQFTLRPGEQQILNGAIPIVGCGASHDLVGIVSVDTPQKAASGQAKQTAVG